VTITIDEVLVGDDPDAWRAAGFTVDGEVSRIGSVAVRLDGADGPRGVRRWSLRGASDSALTAFVAAEGIETASSTAPAVDADVHPLGVTRIDHVVLMTPNVARTTASLEALGLDVRRVRDAAVGDAPIRQVFFRLGEVVLEVVGAPEGEGEGPATFWGITHRVADIDAAAARLGERCGRVRDAVQPGRRITTVRTGEIGMSVATALISAKP
jgi:catechol 2,3-dioxygenase-like lactoylglutathione lyase family enzyme